jgi:hypothetical protein
MRKLIVAILLVGLLAVAPRSSSAQKGEGLSKLMVEKLNNAKLLLEGIALSDFKKIDRSAEKLIQLSKTAEWFVYKTARYELHSNEFRRAAEVILQKAQDKNLDGVALAYFDMTMACIRCHQYVREVRDARLTNPFHQAQAKR